MIRCLAPATRNGLVVAVVALAGMVAGVSLPAADAPNIVFVLADDLGWAELGCYGNAFHETPHLDRLAKEGLRFTQAYAAAPVCSPYRAALLSGQSPARSGIVDYLRPNSANGLETDLITLPERLRDAGYQTGMVGKWHLSGYRFHDAEFELRPIDHGFTFNIGSETKGVGNGANTFPYVFRQQPRPWVDLPENRLGPDEYLTDRLNLEAVDFIERAAAEDRPFFLYLAHYAPHSILNGRADLVDKYRHKRTPGPSGRANCYLCEDAGLGKGDPGNHWATHHNPHLAAMVESIDQGVGEIVAKLEALGLADNTLLVFTSDNGGESNVTSNVPLRGGKSELYEGGVRVPLIVRWPSRLEGGRLIESPTVNTDFFPTLLEAAGVGVPEDQPVDGQSQLAVWTDSSAPPAERVLYWHYPLDQPHFLGGFSGGAIRSGGWKLIERFDPPSVELYDLNEDPSETRDLSDEHAVVAEALAGRLEAWREEVGARMPSAPLLTESRQLYFGDHFKTGLVSERLWYNRDWVAEDGILKRLPSRAEGENTRIFLREAEYKDALIRFDFRLGEAKDVRLMTGSGGGYNAVIHLRPDHFFIQTAIDRSVPYFPYRHGECAFAFEPERWYTLTVEFIGDEVVAHIDSDHVAYAKHPIIDRTRQYLALQVDEHAAAFDNLQVFTAVSKRGDAAAAGREILAAARGRFPVERSLLEELNIRKTNAHEWHYQRSPEYRALVDRVAELDSLKKERFPQYTKTSKDYQKTAQAERKRLEAEDPRFKERLRATHQANRALDAYLFSKQPGMEAWPRSKREAQLERLRLRHQADPGYRDLLEVARSVQADLEAAYPQVFVDDDAIRELKRVAAEQASHDPEYKAARDERAAAYRAQQEKLLEMDETLRQLDSRVATEAVKSSGQAN